MSEYPWDMENMVLAQHDQPCDCAICDEIWYNREVRRNRRKNVLDEVTRLKAALDVAERQRDDKWVESGLLSEMRRNDLLNADIKRLQQDLCMWQEMHKEVESKLKKQQQKCNIYNCMDRKDLKLRIEQLDRDYESLKAENAELRRINHSLAANNQNQLSAAHAEIESLKNGAAEYVKKKCAEYEQLWGETVNLQAECERLKDLLNQHETYTNENWYKELQAKLSSYEQATEVEGELYVCLPSGHYEVCARMPLEGDYYPGKRVKVLVMPMGGDNDD